MTDSWDPQLYDRFRRERLKPAHDLMDWVKPEAEMRIIDLGCGTGEITQELHTRFGARFTLGIDRSPAMLGQARLREHAGLRFLQADISTFTPDWPVGLVFSNAALQWAEDHPALFEKFQGWLEPGGQIAIQVPCADWHATHTVAETLAEQYGTGPLYHGRRRVLSAAEYAELLFKLGFAEQRVATHVYGNVLESIDELVTFFSATLLNPYKAAFGEQQFQAFLADYRNGLAESLGEATPVFFPMTRTLIWAQR